MNGCTVMKVTGGLFYTLTVSFLGNLTGIWYLKNANFFTGIFQFFFKNTETISVVSKNILSIQKAYYSQSPPFTREVFVFLIWLKVCYNNKSICSSRILKEFVSRTSELKTKILNQFKSSRYGFLQKSTRTDVLKLRVDV